MNPEDEYCPSKLKKRQLKEKAKETFPLFEITEIQELDTPQKYIV
jgi:hypothetical protein